MKNILSVLTILSLTASLTYANSSKTTTTTRYEETTSNPSENSDMIERQESYDENLDDQYMEQEDSYYEDNYNEERMEEDRIFDDENVIDYSDRTRTNRERKALNTGSNASDDE